MDDLVSVPQEPTDEMLLAAECFGVMSAGSDLSTDDMTRGVYYAMLAARPVSHEQDQAFGSFSPKSENTHPATADSAGQWQWWASRNEEQYLVGPCGTREEAIQSATEDFDGEPFHIVEACKGSMAAFLPSGERLIEWMTEYADDNGAFGEDDYCELVGKPEAITAAEADATAVLTDWFTRHSAIFPEPWAFAATRNGEWITPATGEA